MRLRDVEKLARCPCVLALPAGGSAGGYGTLGHLHQSNEVPYAAYAKRGPILVLAEAACPCCLSRNACMPFACLERLFSHLQVQLLLRLMKAGQLQRVHPLASEQNLFARTGRVAGVRPLADKHIHTFKCASLSLALPLSLSMYVQRGLAAQVRKARVLTYVDVNLRFVPPFVMYACGRVRKKKQVDVDVGMYVSASVCVCARVRERMYWSMQYHIHSNKHNKTNESWFDTRQCNKHNLTEILNKPLN